MLDGRITYPSRIKAPGWIRQAIVPELFQPAQICGFGFRSATGDRQIAIMGTLRCGGVRTAQRGVPTCKQRKQHASEAKEKAN